ncbi:MAG: cardiolipin synthase ClsB [Sideroxydans sp.]|nr:cardiolipin synthase ClsB [Sideroxydans sp.]
MSRSFQVGTDNLTLLQNGTEFFPSLCADIDAAQHSVRLETYIFAPDETGRLISLALQHAAQRRVVVHLLIDGFGSSDLPDAWVEEMRSAGVEVLWFRREHGFFSMRRYRWRRMHRKLAVIDGETAYVGGINIVNDIPDDEAFDEPRLDYAVRMQGPVVRDVQEAMRHLWSSVRWASMRKRIGRLRVQLRRHKAAEREQGATLLLRDNVRHRHEIEAAYLHAINQAQHEVVLAHAYFLPGRPMRRALKRAAKRGVRVVLLLQGRVEYQFQYYATQYLYGQMLAAGVEIYEYRESFMHAKACIVDGAWATLGSSNLDPFSLWMAREANLAVRDADFAGHLRDSVMYAVQNHADQILRPPKHPLAVFLSRLSYGGIRLLVGLLVRQRH